MYFGDAVIGEKYHSLHSTQANSKNLMVCAVMFFDARGKEVTNFSLLDCVSYPSTCTLFDMLARTNNE